MGIPKHNISIILAVIALTVAPTQLRATNRGGQIVIGPNAPAMEQYAARELQRYLYQVSGSFLPIESVNLEARLAGPVFVIGTRESNPLIAKLAAEGQVQVSTTDPGPQSYVLKKVGQASRMPNSTATLVIAGSDAVGCLYGVYLRLLSEYMDRVHP